MEYEEWAKLEREHPWLWAIVPSGNFLHRTVGFRRATMVDPFELPKPFPDSRVWFIGGADMGMLLRPRVFSVEEIPWRDDLTLHAQARKLGWTSGLYGIYVVVGTVRSYYEGENLIVYKRPNGVADMRSLLY
jgi:hypothetical protein